MNLEYKVLWFENDEAWYDVTADILRSEIEDLGFTFQAVRVAGGENIDSLLVDPDVDLILMDYSLDNVCGDELMERIRKQEVFTEIVFYSAHDTLSLGRKVFDKGVDGVYLAHRDDFEDKVLGVVRTTIKKVLDLSTMRGLVMAEVSDHDATMAEIIRLYHDAVDEEKGKSVRASIGRRMKESLDGRGKHIEKLVEDDDLQSMISSREFDMDKKARTLSQIVKALPDTQCGRDCAELIRGYQSQILGQRNKLAHVREAVGDDGRKQLQGEDDFVFDDQACREIRHALKAHGDNLKTLRANLDGGGLPIE